MPCPALRTSGGFPYRELLLSPAEWAFWEAINDSRSLAQIEERVGSSRAIHKLASFETQAVQLWPRRVAAARLRHLEAPLRPDHERSAQQFDPRGHTALSAYHDEIVDTRAAVEVGCGTGELARDWGEAAYLRVDRSLNLLQAQHARAPGSLGLLADATALPLRSALAAHARREGLSAKLTRLDDLLGVDLHTPQISRHSYAALRALFRARGLSLAARAWTPHSLELPWPVEGIEWTTLADEGPGPLITRFWALLLRR